MGEDGDDEIHALDELVDLLRVGSVLQRLSDGVERIQGDLFDPTEPCRALVIKAQGPCGAPLLAGGQVYHVSRIHRHYLSSAG